MWRNLFGWKFWNFSSLSDKKENFFRTLFNKFFLWILWIVTMPFRQCCPKKWTASPRNSRLIFERKTKNRWKISPRNLFVTCWISVLTTNPMFLCPKSENFSCKIRKIKKILLPKQNFFLQMIPLGTINVVPTARHKFFIQKSGKFSLKTR